jgi:phospholipid transport system substrate-binding protein
MQFSAVLKKVMAILIISLLLPWSVSAETGPLQVIQSGTEKALEILRDRGPDGRPNLRDRRGEILTIVDQYFDFEEMARRSLGTSWRHQSPQKQEEFVRLFKDLLFNTYVDRVESYTSANEQVVFDSQQIDGNHAFVGTRVIGYRGADVNVDYRLIQRNGRWKVYDVIIAGISLVSNYRSQFNSILARRSFDDLLQTMSNKVSAQRRAA